MSSGSFYKYIPNPAHLFECTTPPAPEEIKIYQHPFYPIKMYSNGIFFIDSEHDFIFNPRRHDGHTVSRGYTKMPLEEFYDMWGKAYPNSKRWSTTIRLKMAETMAYECYHNVHLKDNYQVHFLNHNPYDLRKENLFCTHDTPAGYEYRKDWLKSNSAFNKRTIEEINRRVEKVTEKGLDPDKYIQLLDLPKKYYNLWKKSYGKIDV